ncbi:2-keto-4-pentenoate hydratase [Mesobacillus jeotgali]|uniref:2-keto-4-pentenoate hydratase n=1 Tax=Mesobacillus jeotgali TaxID=129985 RepID=UPI0009A87446|nr:fumarylacetoacetate hydrolase family protein [Mesobacillus jeotgali]
MLDYRVLAEYLLKAEKQKQAVSCISDKVEHFNLEMGYRVQQELVKSKVESGNRVTAYKMGLTSQAKMKQMKVDTPIYGYIFDYMDVPDKGQIRMEDFIHPKVEAELAFILGEDIEGTNVTGEQVLERTQWILPALEIIDSRYENFRFKLPDVVADNTSASRVIFGNRLFQPQDFAVDSIGVSMSLNGEIRASGVSSAVLGNPANSVALLAKMLYEEKKEKMKKGSVILTGGITEAVLLKKGDHVITEYEGMGEVSFQVL